MGWSIQFNDKHVELGDIQPRLFLPIATEHEVYWYDFYAVPLRYPEAAVALARVVALDNGSPYHPEDYELETMAGLLDAVNLMYVWEDDDLPKVGTVTDSPSTDDPTTETSSGSSDTKTGSRTKREVSPPATENSSSDPKT